MEIAGMTCISGSELLTCSINPVSGIKRETKGVQTGTTRTEGSPLCGRKRQVEEMK